MREKSNCPEIQNAEPDIETENRDGDESAENQSPEIDTTAQEKVCTSLINPKLCFFKPPKIIIECPF